MSYRPHGFTDYINASEYGVVPSASYNFGGISGNTVTLGASTGTLFASTDVSKAILLKGAATNGADLWTTIIGYTSPTVVTTAASAPSPVSDITIFWGTNANVGGNPSFVDQVPNLTNAINAATAKATGLYVPSGAYCYGSVLTFGPLGSNLDPADTMPAIRGSGETFFVAQNPASAPPQGFIKMQDLFSFAYIGDFGVYGPSMPSVGSLTPGAEVAIWVSGGTVENVNVWSTSFFRGLHMRLTNATARNCLDYGISMYELDGTVVDDCSASGVTFSNDEPDTLGGAYSGGGLGGAVNGFAAVNYNPNNLTAYYNNGSATITNVAVVSNVLTVTAANPFQVGQYVVFYGVGTATFLNGQTVRVASASGTQFTASFTHADYGPTADTGTAVSVRLLSYFSFDGFLPGGGTNPVTFNGCIVSSGPGAPVPYGYYIDFLNAGGISAVLSGCDAEGVPIGFLAGAGSILHACYGTGNGAADFVTSEGQVPWVASKNYYVGEYVIDPAGHKQTVIVSGVSGGSAPAWNDAGSTTTDNTVTWQDGGVFSGTLATYAKLDGCFTTPSVGPSAFYPWWNAALNADANFNLNTFGGGTTLYSTQSPVLLTGLTSTFTSKILYSLSGTQQGKFLIDYYVATTTAGTGGTVTLSFAWTDIAGNAQTFTVASTVNLTSTTSFISGALPVYAKGGNITCTATVAGATGSPQFAAAISAKQSL